MLDVVKYPDPLLRLNADPVDEFDDKLQTFLDEMIETMYIADGVTSFWSGLFQIRVSVPL